MINWFECCLKNTFQVRFSSREFWKDRLKSVLSQNFRAYLKIFRKIKKCDSQKPTSDKLVDTPANLLSPVMHKIVVVESTMDVSVPGKSWPLKLSSFSSILYEETSFSGSKWRIFDLLWNDRSTGPSFFAAFAKIAFIFDAVKIWLILLDLLCCLDYYCRKWRFQVEVLKNFSPSRLSKMRALKINGQWRADPRKSEGRKWSFFGMIDITWFGSETCKFIQILTLCR